MNSDSPLLSIIIPHFNNYSIIDECLKSLEKTSYKNKEIIVVDNFSSDNSYNLIKNNFKNIKIVRTEKNLGYSGGCNFGIKYSKGEYILFLNNDTIHKPNFIEPLIKYLEKNKDVSSVQPKIINFNNKDYFDYAGASGGFLDYLVYPFCRGRIFNTIEMDQSQYNNKIQVFWTSGTAFITRKKIFDLTNGFDEKLFCHMEEIDYCWKNYIMGYKNYVIPESVVFHKGGQTLANDSAYKKYLNHRNSMILLLTNFQLKRSVLFFLLRVILEIISSLFELVKLKPLKFIYHYKALFFLIFNFNYIISRRKFIKKIRKKTDQELFNQKIIYNNSIVKKYFIQNKKYFSDII
jgi:hypothetical protein